MLANERGRRERDYREAQSILHHPLQSARDIPPACYYR